MRGGRAGRNLGDGGRVGRVCMRVANWQMTAYQNLSLRFLYAKSSRIITGLFSVRGLPYFTRFYATVMYAVWKGTTTEYGDSDGRRHKVPVAGTNLHTAKRPLSGQYFAKSGDYGSHQHLSAVSKITGIRRMPILVSAGCAVDGQA